VPREFKKDPRSIKIEDGLVKLLNNNGQLERAFPVDKVELKREYGGIFTLDYYKIIVSDDKN
jgi:hypothetical protein